MAHKSQLAGFIIDCETEDLDTIRREMVEHIVELVEAKQ